MGKKAAAAAEPPPVEEPVEDEEPIEDFEADICEGDFIFQDGSTYTGQYLKVGEDVVMHGEGHLVSGPESFKGAFEKGAYKSGHFTSCNGEVYKGTFRENIFDGVGEYTWPDGRVYQGMWKAGRMHGPGLFKRFVVGSETFAGFSINGEFKSSSAAQAEAKRQYLTEYRAACAEGASEALRELATKAGSQRAPRKFLAPPEQPGEGEDSRAAADRALVAAAMLGPFPEGAVLNKEVLGAFVAGLAEDAEKPLEVIVYEAKGQAGQRLEGRRLLLPQLQYAGQAVEFALPAQAVEGAPPGALKALVLVNVSDEYSLEKARWKVGLAEAVPQPVAE